MDSAFGSVSPDGRELLYDTTDPSVGGWGIVGGTSEASPLFSGIVPVSHGTNSYTFCVAADIQGDQSCASSADLVNVPGFNANGSYNDATGWGTVNAAKFVPTLADVAGGQY